MGRSSRPRSACATLARASPLPGDPMTKIKHKPLGSSGLKVSEFCIGTMTFGATTEQAEAQRIVDHAADNGVNFIDTANTYVNGASEEGSARCRTSVGTPAGTSKEWERMPASVAEAYSTPATTTPSVVVVVVFVCAASTCSPRA